MELPETNIKENEFYETSKEDYNSEDQKSKGAFAGFKESPEQISVSRSPSSPGKFGDSSGDESIISEHLFKSGKDDIILGAELYKFHPGISSNFVSRYVQISRKAFRYFKNKFHTAGGKPLVAFRKKIILKAIPYTIENVSSYLKPGARITKSHKEDALFQNMFELIL